MIWGQCVPWRSGGYHGNMCWIVENSARKMMNHVNLERHLVNKPKESKTLDTLQKRLLLVFAWMPHFNRTHNNAHIFLLLTTTCPSLTWKNAAKFQHSESPPKKRLTALRKYCAIKYVFYMNRIHPKKGMWAAVKLPFSVLLFSKRIEKQMLFLGQDATMWSCPHQDKSMFAQSDNLHCLRAGLAFPFQNILDTHTHIHTYFYLNLDPAQPAWIPCEISPLCLPGAVEHTPSTWLRLERPGGKNYKGILLYILKGRTATNQRISALPVVGQALT